MVSADVAAILAFLSGNPVISAAGLSSCLTLIGVIFSQWVSSRHLEKKLSHEHKLRRSEHESDLKREIYFDAIEALVNATETLKNIANNEKLEFKLDKNTSAKFTKLYIVADFETIKIFKKAEMLLSFKFIEVSGLLFDLHISNIEASNSQKMIELYSKTNTDIIAQMKELNREKNSEKSIWDSLNSQMEENQRLLSVEIEKKLAHEIHSGDCKIQLAKKLSYENQEELQTIIDVILQFRKDFGRPLKEQQEYLDLMFGCADTQGKLATRLFADIDARVTKIKNSISE